MKKYRTKDGQEVEFITREGKGKYCLVGYVLGCYTVHQWSLEGIRMASRSSDDNLRLVEVSPYEDFKIDDPVLVCDGRPGGFQQRAHFAGIAKDGRPMAWKDGRTSWTALNRTDLTHTWNNCEKEGVENV